MRVAFRKLVLLWLCFTVLVVARVAAAQESTVPVHTQGKVYIVLWFDTEDYILPQSDDAALRIATMLSRLGVRATFKVVGEKGRTLERRGRRDVINALSRHEIGYHSNTHSQHPTPAEYEEAQDWEGGVAEFTRRERSGFDDLRRIFGKAPTCYGQPGSSWAPQSFAALKSWGVNVYLDEGEQVGLDGKPFWYGGLLNIFNTREGSKIRSNDDWSNLADAKKNFQEFYARMTAQPEGGVISMYFHPAEFVHQEFWDAVNFIHGANPPREEWKLPPMKPREQAEKSFQYLEDIVTFMKSYPQVRFITASEAFNVFRDASQGRTFTTGELADIARRVSADVTFQSRDGYALSASEVFSLLNQYVAGRIRGAASPAVQLKGTPYGPSMRAAESEAAFSVPWSQFSRTALDVQGYMERNNQIPNVVWFGSVPVSPERYLVALAGVVATMIKNGKPPETIPVGPARLEVAKYVADDSPQLWGWIIFPPGFRAPNLMALAKLQAWTLKPATLHESNQ